MPKTIKSKTIYEGGGGIFKIYHLKQLTSVFRTRHGNSLNICFNNSSKNDSMTEKKTLYSDKPNNNAVKFFIEFSNLFQTLAKSTK